MDEPCSIEALQFLARAVYPNNPVAQRLLVEDWIRQDEEAKDGEQKS